MTKHTRLESAVCGIISRWTLQKPLRNQRVPTWDRQVNSAAGSRTEAAILDIEYTDAGARRWVDVTVRQCPPSSVW